MIYLTHKSFSFPSIVSTLSLLLCLNTFSLAEGWGDNFKGIWGLGTSVLESNYVNTDTKTSLSPYIFGSVGAVQIEANRVLYPLYSTPSYTLLATGHYRTQQYSEELAKDKSLELGLSMNIPLSHGYTSRLSALTDVSDTHNGYELEVQVYKHNSLGKLSILSALALQYQDDKLANYYYGTQNYSADDGYVFEAEVIASYPLGDFSVFTGLRSYWYGSNITDSPLASSSNTLLGFFGVGYRF